MKILVLMTGGTIGSTVKDGWITTDRTAKYVLLENYKNTFGNGTDFTVLEPYCLLSENLCAEKLNLLIDAVRENLSGGYDGIIITHGTDSLHFSAVAIHLAFSGADVPIVFVSANYPIENPLSNGNANFEGAVKFIESGVKTGVYVSYKNPDGKHYFHSAINALGFNETDDSIYSLENKPFGIYNDGCVEISDTYPVDNFVFRSHFCETPKILSVTVAPGDSFDYNLKGYNAVILRPYHSGTINNESAYFKAFLKKAANENLPVFLANAPFGTTYETVKEAAKLNIIPLPRTTFAAVYMRLWAGISENKNLKNLF